MKKAVYLLLGPLNNSVFPETTLLIEALKARFLDGKVVFQRPHILDNSKLAVVMDVYRKWTSRGVNHNQPMSISL